MRNWKSWLVWLVLMLALAAAAVWFAGQAADVYQNSGLTDFDILFRSAQTLARGGSPYDVPGLAAAPFGGYYKFPPLVDLLLAPLTRFDWRTVARAYILISLALYLATFLLLARTQRLDPRAPPFYLLAIIFLVFQPSIDTLNGAQHEFLILLTFSVAAAALQHAPPRQGLAGVILSIPIIIKLYPLLLLLFLAVRRFWRAILALVVSLALLMALSIGLGGWELQRQFWLEILPRLSGGTATLENQSFFAFFARLWVNGAAVDPARVTVLPIATWLSYIAIASSILLSLFVLWRAPDAGLGFAVMAPLMLLAGPNAWIHYETVLLLPIAILLGVYGQRAAALDWLLLALAVALVAFGNEDNVRETTLGVIQSYKFYGVLLVWVLGLRACWQAAPRPLFQPVLPCSARANAMAPED